ncbi:MAG: hypothetical protein ACXWC6_15360 [Ramlibacter sp.]
MILPDLAAPAPAVHLPATAIVALVVFIAWRVVARIRRLVTRQPLRAWRAWFSLLLFPWVGIGLLVRLWGDAGGLAAGFAGIAAGALLSLVALRRTRFEATDAGLFYTHDARVGIGLSLLVVSRVVYRLVQIALHPAILNEPPEAFLHRPVTLAILGTLIGYYTGYAAGLLRRRRALRAGRERAS